MEADIKRYIEEAIEKENTMTSSMIARYMQSTGLKIEEICLIRKNLVDGIAIFVAPLSEYKDVPIVIPPED